MLHEFSASVGLWLSEQSNLTYLRVLSIGYLRAWGLVFVKCQILWHVYYSPCWLCGLVWEDCSRQHDSWSAAVTHKCGATGQWCQVLLVILFLFFFSLSRSFPPPTPTPLALLLLLEGSTIVYNENIDNNISANYLPDFILTVIIIIITIKIFVAPLPYWAQFTSQYLGP